MVEMESLEILQKIRDIEDLSAKKIEQAQEKAKNLVEETEKKNEEKTKKAEKEAHDMINAALENVGKETAKTREDALKEADKKAAIIKPLDEKEMLKIFDETLREEFKL